MATPGRRPKPTHLKIIEGNPGKRALKPTAEAKIEPLAPDMPHWLSPYAQEEWERVVPQLEKMGLIGEIDRASLVVYCEAVSVHRSSVELLNRSNNAPLIPGRRNAAGEAREAVKHPVLQVIRDQANLIAKMSAEFGMTSSARARMVLPDDPHSDLLDLL